MTLAQLRTRVEQYLKFDLDAYMGETATGASLDEAINEAYLDICLDIETTGWADLTLTADVAEYRMSDPDLWGGKQVIAPFRVYIDDVLANWFADGKMMIWREVEALAPGWQSQASATPTCAYILGGDSIGLWPPPDVDTYNVRVFGFVLPAELSETTDVPLLPTPLHKAIAFKAAVLAASPPMSDQSSAAKLAMFSAQADAIVSKYRKRHARNASAIGVVEAAKPPRTMAI